MHDGLVLAYQYRAAKTGETLSAPRYQGGYE